MSTQQVNEQRNCGLSIRIEFYSAIKNVDMYKSWDAHENIDKYDNYTGEKKPDEKKYIVYYAIYKILETQSIVIEHRLVVMWALGWVLGKKGKERGIMKGHEEI